MKAQQFINSCKETPAQALCRKLYSLQISKAGVKPNDKDSPLLNTLFVTPASYTACECTTDIILKKTIMAEEVVNGSR